MTDSDRAAESGSPDPWAAQLNALGGFIRAQRQMAKLSLREMAELTRVSNAYLSQVERGLHQPSLKVLRSIADALQLSTEQLLNQAGWVSSESSSRPASEGSDGASPPSTEDAIRADRRLSEAQREALIGVYRSFIGVGAE